MNNNDAKMHLKIPPSSLMHSSSFAYLCAPTVYSMYIAINLNANYPREMKFIPINVNYCILSFVALIFFLRGLFSWGEGSITNFNFFNVNPKFDNEIVKFIA